MLKSLCLVAALMASALPLVAAAQTTAHTVGQVVTSKNFTGPDDTIGVIRFEDPKVKGAFCYFSMSKKGGFASNFGLEEDRSEYVLDCFATGPLTLPAGLPDQEVISERSRSAVFKKLYVARMVDRQAGRLVYVAYTRFLIDGSPKQAMSSVPFRP